MQAAVKETSVADVEDSDDSDDDLDHVPEADSETAEPPAMPSRPSDPEFDYDPAIGKLTNSLGDAVRAFVQLEVHISLS